MAYIQKYKRLTCNIFQHTYRAYFLSALKLKEGFNKEIFQRFIDLKPINNYFKAILL